MHGGEDGQNHVVPSMFQSEADHEHGDEEEDGSWVCNDQTGFRVDVAIVSASIETADSVVHPVPDEPADERAYDAEEVEVAYIC